VNPLEKENDEDYRKPENKKQNDKNDPKSVQSVFSSNLLSAIRSIDA